MRIVAAVIICFITLGCAGEPVPVQDLPEWNGKLIQEMIRVLGVPTEETEKTVGTIPTKDWNHGIVFSVYSKDKPENLDVVIKIYSWNQGDYQIRACCHLVKKAWLVMGAMQIHKDVRF